MGTKSSIAGQSAKCCCFILKSACICGCALLLCSGKQLPVQPCTKFKNASANTVILDDSAFFHSRTGLHKCITLPRPAGMSVSDKLQFVKLWRFASTFHSGELQKEGHKSHKFMRKHHVQKHFYTDAPKCRGSDFSPCRHEPKRVCFHDIKLHHFPQMNLYVKNAQCLLHLKGLCFTF